MSNLMNEKQIEAVNSSNEPLLIVAGAGSGKTYVLTQRILFLVKNIEIPVYKILAFTFTNKAANEIKKRISTIIPDSYFKWIGTFHSICLKILREDAHILGRANNFLLIDEDDQTSILKEIYLTNNLSKDTLSIRKALEIISRLKANNITSKEDIIEYLADHFLSSAKKNVLVCVEEYANYLIQKNYFDFDDLIKNVNKIFKQDKEVLNKWKMRFDYILVDEFQDTNDDQFSIIKYLTKDSKNIFVVGDPDQMIYSWRGANSKIFFDFQKFYPNYKMIILEQNYRSSQNILDISNALIKNNKDRVEKALFTKNLAGNNISYFNANSADSESKWIAEKIVFLTSALKHQYSDIAILYRSNYLSRGIEQYLFRRNIPYIVYGGLKFYRRKEIKDILSYLKYVSVNDEVSLARIYNTPRRKFSSKTYDELVKFAKIKNTSVHDVLTNHLDEVTTIGTPSKNSCRHFNHLINKIKEYKYLTISDLIDFIINEIKYDEYLRNDDELYRLENINELKDSITTFQKENVNSTLYDYLQEVALYSESNDNVTDNNFVTLMTVHASKGLEFKNIFILGFNDEIFPSGRSILDGTIAEERRIAYVAMTRAKENLFITSSGGVNYQNNNSAKIPSRFISEISNSNCLDIIEEVSPWEKYDNNNSFKQKDINIEDNYHDGEVFFEMGDTISHIVFGVGLIVSVFEEKLIISFPAPWGTKHLNKNHKSITKL